MDADDLVPLSALQHFVVCPRQCALIHVEQIWQDNQSTAEGIALHRSTESEWAETRPGVRRVYGVALRSDFLGVIGRADVVEFLDTPNETPCPYPVEFKRGRPKRDDRDRVQLCAQAICLEEMMGRSVDEGALFYGEPRRRDIVSFDAALRARTKEVADAVRTMIQRGETPRAPAKELPDCRGCSLYSLCSPAQCGRPDGPVARYFTLAFLDEGLSEDGQ